VRVHLNLDKLDTTTTGQGKEAIIFEFTPENKEDEAKISSFVTYWDMKRKNSRGVITIFYTNGPTPPLPSCGFCLEFKKIGWMERALFLARSGGLSEFFKNFLIHHLFVFRALSFTERN